MVNPAIAGRTAAAFELLLAVLVGKDVPAALRTWAIVMSQAHAQGRDLTESDLNAVAALAETFGVSAAPPVVAEPPAPPPPAPPEAVSHPPPEQTFSESLRNAASYFALTGNVVPLTKLVDREVARQLELGASNVQPDQPGAAGGAAPATAPVDPVGPGAAPG